MSALVRIFVYGTLKRGHRNHKLLAGQTFLGEARSEPCYRLFDNGHYPCLIPASEGNAIRGELYLVDAATLRLLDRLEGVPDLYVRGHIRVQGEEEPALAYFYQREVGTFSECGEEWPGVGL